MYRTRDMGGLPPKLDRPKGWNTFLGGAAMSLYETLMVAIAVIKLIYDILSDLFRRRNDSARKSASG